GTAGATIGRNSITSRGGGCPFRPILVSVAVGAGLIRAAGGRTAAFGGAPGRCCFLRVSTGNAGLSWAAGFSDVSGAVGRASAVGRAALATWGGALSWRFRGA